VTHVTATSLTSRTDSCGIDIARLAEELPAR